MIVSTVRIWLDTIAASQWKCCHLHDVLVLVDELEAYCTGGKTGHWSRDCTAPQSEWVNRQAVPGQNGSQAAQAPADRPDQTPAPLEALPQKKKRAVKPKLTFDVLQASCREQDLVSLLLT